MMRRLIIRLLGGCTRDEMVAAVRDARESERAAANEKFRLARRRVMSGGAVYGAPPLAEYQANGLMSGVE